MVRCRNQCPTTPESVAAIKAITDAANSRLASMGWTWCACCKERVPVEDTFPGNVVGCGPFCSECRSWWETSPTNAFGDGCPHDGSRWEKR